MIGRVLNYSSPASTAMYARLALDPVPYHDRSQRRGDVRCGELRKLCSRILRLLSPPSFVNLAEGYGAVRVLQTQPY